MNPGYLRWKINRQLAEAQAVADQIAADAAAAAADATAALADAAAADAAAAAAAADAAAAQTDATTGISDAADAQDTADEALTVANGVGGVVGQQQTSGGQSPMPYIVPIGGGTAAQIFVGGGVPYDSIQYRINGGSYGGYSGQFAIGPGDTVEAYSVTSGLTDSDVYTYEN